MILQKKNIHMVKVYDNIIPSATCKKLLDLFEKNTEHHEYIDCNSCPCFTQLNVNDTSIEIAQLIVPYIIDVYKKYKEDIKSKYIPNLKDLEAIRIKRYLTNGNERFDEHVDVTDYDSSIRAVAFLIYLNSSNGNTLFPSQNLNIQPVSGRVVIFPPTWEYPHTGLAPTDNPKYILSTYVHYGTN